MRSHLPSKTSLRIKRRLENAQGGRACGFRGGVEQSSCAMALTRTRTQSMLKQLMLMLIGGILGGALSHLAFRPSTRPNPSNNPSGFSHADLLVVGSPRPTLPSAPHPHPPTRSSAPPRLPPSPPPGPPTLTQLECAELLSSYQQPPPSPCHVEGTCLSSVEQARATFQPVQRPTYEPYFTAPHSTAPAAHVRELELFLQHGARPKPAPQTASHTSLVHVLRPPLAGAPTRLARLPTGELSQTDREIRITS